MTIHRVRLSLAVVFAAMTAGAGCGGNTPGAGKPSDAAAEHSPASGGSSGTGSGGDGSGASGASGGNGSGGGGGSGGRTDGGASDAGPGCEPGAPVGTIRPAGDGCNSCICSVGNFWACTTAFCQPDAAPSDASSGSGGRAGTGGVGGGTGGNGGGATGGSGGAGGGRAACAAAEMLGRSCTVDTECVAVHHITDCCGSSRVMGLRAAELDRFRGLETQCAASYPACECAPRPPQTDDGSAIRTATNVAIACLGGVCTTFHVSCGRPCTDGRVCATCANGPTTYAACTTSCAGGAACTDGALPLCQTALNGDRQGMYCTAAGIACGTR